MRWATYERWVARYDAAEEMLDAQLAIAAVRLMKRLWRKPWEGEMALVTPQERAESLRGTLDMYIDLVDGDGGGPSWQLTDKAFARIASIIREAENDALERAAELCEAVHLGARTRYSVLLGPDYLVTRSLLSRELATAIRALKHKGES